MGCSSGASHDVAGDAADISDHGTFDVINDSGESSCDEGLVGWEGGGCGPLLEECEPWQLPLVGGGCVAIGARGCPASWSSEADADCQPGELVDCPEGLSLSEDGLACLPVLDDCPEDEVPLPGGGCHPVGPGGVFDDCPPGELALLGGGCVPVGPRACPGLYLPDADVSCTAGEVLDCPAGWEQSEDGAYCRPLWDECGAGQVPLLGGGCKAVVSESDCPAGDYAEPPVGTEQVLYVSALSGCVEDCGTAESPHSSISPALEAAPEGAVILVGEGTYDEGLAVERAVSVIGLCPEKTVITGSVAVSGMPVAEFASAAVSVDQVAGPVVVSGLSLTSLAPGLAVVGSQVQLSRVELSSPRGAGIYVSGGGKVSGVQVWVHDVKFGKVDTFEGVGFWVRDGAHLSLQDSLIESARDTAGKANGAGTTVELTDVVMRDTKCTKAGEGGSGLRLDGKATATLTRVIIERVKESGIRLKHLGTFAVVTDSVVRGVSANDNNDFGLPLAVVSESSLEAHNSLFRGGVYQGLSLNNATVMLDRCVLADTEATASYGNGYGIEASGGSTLVLQGCLLENNTALAVGAWEDSDLDVRGTLVRDTMTDSQGNGGAGFAIYGSGLSLAYSLVENNHEVAVRCEGPGSAVVIEDSVLGDTQPDGGTYGFGINASSQCQLTARRTLLDRNHRAGIAVSVSAQAHLEDSVVRASREVSYVGSGTGATVEAQGRLTMERCLVDNNVYAGVVAFGAKTEVELSEVIISDTQVGTGSELGRGIQASQQAHVTLDRCVVSGNTAEGLGSNGSGTELTVKGSVVRDMQDDPSGTVGLGIALSDGAHVLMEDSLVFRARGSGVGVFGAYGEAQPVLQFVRSVVRQTQSHESGALGRGVQVSGGGKADMAYSLFEGNRYTAGAFYDAGSVVTVHASVFRDTIPDEEGDGGWGILAATGVQLEMRGCLIEGNTEQGVAVFSPNTKAAFSGTVIRDNLPNADGEHGGGLYVAEQSTTLVSDCLLAGNATTGVTAMNLATDLQISRVVVMDTQKGGAWTLDAQGRPVEFQVYGDGIFAGDKVSVKVVQSVLLGNGRCGAYFYNSGGALEDSIIWGNDSYGLALEGSKDWLAYQNEGNHVFGNASGLPPALAAQVTTTPGGLPPPPAPGINL